jgi:hypothetical protein
MAMSLTFDTHNFVKKLKEAGFAERQAEAISEAFKSAQSEIDVATVQDVDSLRRDMKEERVLLRRDMKELEQRMAVKLGAMMVIAVGVVAPIVKLVN